MKTRFDYLKAKYSAKLLSQAVKRDTLLWNHICECTKQYIDIKATERIYIWYNDFNPVCKLGNKRVFKTLDDGYRQFCGSKHICACSRNAQSVALAVNWSTRTEEEKNLAAERKVATSLEKYKLREISNTHVNPLSSKNAVVPTQVFKYSDLKEHMVLFLDTLNVNYQRNVSGLITESIHSVDFYFPDHCFAIDINDLLLHAEHSQGRGRSFHINKTDQLEKLGISLLTIWCDEYLTQRTLVEGKIKTLLNVNNQRIYARKCEFIDVSWTEIKQFYDKNHIQGTTAYKHNTVGLSYNDKLVALLSYTISETHIEITRFAGDGSIVIGGFSKLLARILSDNPECSCISTWADRRWSYGKLYINAGFVETRRLPADYYYTNYVCRFRKEAYRKEKLIKHHGLDPALVAVSTEWQLVNQQLSLDRVWDCGKIRFELNIKNEK